MTLKIIIQGTRGAGKTTLAHFIAQELEVRNFPVRIEESDPPPFSRCLAATREKLRKNGQEIVIETVLVTAPATEKSQGPRISAKAHTDDHGIQIEFDVTPWFETAANVEIIDLARVNWGGDVPADNVLHWRAGQDAEVDRLLTYLQVVNRGHRETLGFECYINEREAMIWLLLHRPAVAAEISAEKTG